MYSIESYDDALQLRLFAWNLWYSIVDIVVQSQHVPKFYDGLMNDNCYL